MRLSTSILLLVLVAQKANAFVVTPPLSTRTTQSLFAVTDKNDNVAKAEVAAAVKASAETTAQKEDEESASHNVECFVVGGGDLVGDDGEKPEVVCTSHPEEYAWLNGIDPKAMKPTDGMEEGSLECVEGHPTRGGVDEYECKSS